MRFTSVSISGQFSQVGQGNDFVVDGFCDASDGTIFRVRFMPAKPGDYAYSVKFRQGDFERVYHGSFQAVEGTHRGMLRVGNIDGRLLSDHWGDSQARHGRPPDTGGEWVNGRGDDTMIMLKGYAHMVHFFTSFEWWKTEPHDELVNNGNFCLAESGRVYVVYLPNGGSVHLKLEQARYDVNGSIHGSVSIKSWDRGGRAVDLTCGTGQPGLGAAPHKEPERPLNL